MSNVIIFQLNAFPQKNFIDFVLEVALRIPTLGPYCRASSCQLHGRGGVIGPKAAV